MPAAIGTNTVFGGPQDFLPTSEAELEAEIGVTLETEAEAASDISTHNSAATAHGQVLGVFPISKGGTGGSTEAQARTGLEVPRRITTTANPNAGAGTAGAVGDECTDSTHAVAYRNIDGTPTGWVALN